MKEELRMQRTGWDGGRWLAVSTTKERKNAVDRKRERRKKLPGGEVSAAHGAESCSTKCTLHAVRNKPKISFQSRKPFRVLLWSSFYMKMQPGFDKTAATAPSTLNSLVETQCSTRSSLPLLFGGFLRVLRAACSSCSLLSSQLKRSWLVMES